MPKKTEKLFVYGIFLDESNRNYYGMSNPEYATVPGFTTVGDYIVQARYVGGNHALTGLLVDMDSSRWDPLDRLEAGYDRIKVTTSLGETAWMYAERQYYENREDELLSGDVKARVIGEPNSRNFIGDEGRRTREVQPA